MKKVWSLSAVAASVVLLVGCGSSSSTSSSVVETGKAYYLDSAVAGVNYKCGTQEGITGVNGEFTFEVGQSCTFYIGDVKLRDMDKALLSDGAKIVEDDLQVAALLQSLDSDGNPDNGITLTVEVVEAFTAALQENGNEGALPTTPEELEAVVASIENNVTEFSGHAVTLEEAQAHLEATQTAVQTESTKALLAGKTFYSVHADERILIKIAFNADVTAFTETNLATSQSEVHPIRIEGDRWYGLDDTDGSYTIISQADGYIYFDDRYADGSKDGIGHRLYTSQADAEAYLDSLGGGDEEPITKFSTEWLNGRTLYFVQYDDFGYDGEGEPGMQWNMARMDFTENTMSWTEYDLPNTSTGTFTYSITSDGKIDIDEEHFGQIELQSQTDDYLKVCQDGDCNTYLFFDESKARTFRDSQNK